jgi:hypothetical protein
MGVSYLGIVVDTWTYIAILLFGLIIFVIILIATEKQRQKRHHHMELQKRRKAELRRIAG